MDGEITRFFYRLLADYPQLLADHDIQVALAGNQHIVPYPSTVPWAPLDRLNTSSGHGYWIPSSLSRRSRLNTLLSLYHFPYDFILLSDGLDELPLVNVTSIETAIICRIESASALLSGQAPESPLKGRLMRIPIPAKESSHSRELHTLPGWSDIRTEGAHIFFGNYQSETQQPQSSVLNELSALLPRHDNKPTCLVLPIFMAVGGVERNTVEMMRELQHDYHFVVVTTERLSKSQGSLHYQLDELDIPTFDLAEVAEREHHLSILTTLAGLIRPNLVWICNGSPWLVENALAIRQMFARIPIIDQQVYDTDFGWINHYHQKGIQSFDHFIAINARIREKFIRHLRIPVHRVSLIYSAVNAPKLRTSRLETEDIAAVRQQVSLPPNRARTFAFVGRLTDQKRPTMFLEIARRSQESGATDQFVLVGDGHLGGDCTDFIELHRLANVIRIPFSPQTARLLAVVDGLVLTSEYEGLPIVMLEALAVGTPIFATDVGDIRLILEQYGSGSVFSTEAKADAVWVAFVLWSGLLETYKRNALNARDAALERFSSRAVAAAYHHCFSSCIQAYRSRSVLSDDSRAVS